MEWIKKFYQLTFLFLILFILSPLFSLSAQSDEEVVSSAQETEEIADDNSSVEPQKSEDQILDESLLKDIETSSYDELVFWSRRLGLDYSGSKSALEQRLKDLYGVSGSSGMKPKEGDTIEIESAEKTSYYKIEEVDEDYIRIVGNVAVLLAEKEGDDSTSHRITADYIIFNKKQKLMTAYGHVLYEKTTGNNVDFFKGDSLVFNIDSWEGVIYQGVSEKEKESKKEGGESSTNTFYYSGEKLIKGKDDKIKMINGKISSSEGDFPIYSISADNIWVLGPGEWAIRRATIRVGEVPLMALPFFLKWGDSFVFNPAVGKSDDIGRYLNTTYYIFGKKKDKGSADSFNFLDPSSGSDSENSYQDGLFLRNGKKPDEEHEEEESSDAEKSEVPPLTAQPDTKNDDDAKSETDVAEEDRKAEAREKLDKWKKKLKKDWNETVKVNDETYLKLMVDAYSNIGQYVGIDGNIAGFEHIKQAKFHFGLGFSYFGTASGGQIADGMRLVEKVHFSEWNENPLTVLQADNLVTSLGPVVDHSYFFGNLVPFRYGMEAKFNYANPLTYWNTTLDMSLYSDSQYTDHFLKYRQETFDFERAMGLTEDDPIYPDPGVDEKVQWSFKNSFMGLEKAINDYRKEAKKSSISPYIKSFNINHFLISADFLNKNFKDTLINYAGDNVLEPATVVKEFYAPQKIFMPDIKISMSGSLFDKKYDLSGAASNAQSQQQAPIDKIDGLRAPWEAAEDESESVGFDEGLKSEPLFDSIKSAQQKITNLFSHSLTYNLSTLGLSLSGYFITEEPETPQLFHQLGVRDSGGQRVDQGNLIRNQLSKAVLNLQGDASMLYRASFLDDMITINETLALKSKYQHTPLSNQVMDEEEGGEQSDLDEREQTVGEGQALQVTTLEDKKASDVSLTSTLNVKVSPFKFYTPLARSSIAYSLTNTLVNYDYDTITNQFELEAGLWDSTNVSTHSLKTSMSFDLMDQAQSISLNVELPPKPVKVSPSFTTNLGVLTNTMNFDVEKLHEDEKQIEDATTLKNYSAASLDLRNILANENSGRISDNWRLGNISNSASFKFTDNISVSNNLTYDVRQERLTALGTNFDAQFLDGKLKFKQSINVIEVNGELRPDNANFKLDLWNLSIDFKAAKARREYFNWEAHDWAYVDGSLNELVPKSLTFGLNYSYDSPPLWKNRITLGFTVNTKLSYDFLRYTQSNLSFDLDLRLKIHEFLTFSLSTKSLNEGIFEYSQSLVNQINDGNKGSKYTKRNFFEDLFKSFGSEDDRKESNFNLSSINFNLTHHLGEWDLTFSYSGQPSLNDLNTTVQNNETKWRRSFSISLAWGAIDMIKTDIKMSENDELTF